MMEKLEQVQAKKTNNGSVIYMLAMILAHSTKTFHVLLITATIGSEMLRNVDARGWTLRTVSHTEGKKRKGW